MNGVVQPISFSGSLNTDVDLKTIKVGDYINALNFRNIYTENGIDGSCENISSNSSVSYTLGVGTNKCIGVYEDIPGNTMFYFIWNSNADNRVLRYIPSNDGSDSIIQD